jgi:hypothetical protein
METGMLLEFVSKDNDKRRVKEDISISFKNRTQFYYLN